MKKDRLLEIIREEIAGALNEIGQSSEEMNATRLSIEAAKAKIAAAQKELQQLQKTGVTEVELEEDQLNEMAYDIIIAQPNELAKLQDKIKDSTKKGEIKLAKALEIIQKTKKEGKPIRQRDIANEMGVIQQEVNPLINKLIDVGILEKGESVTGVTKKTVTDKPQGRPAGEPKAEKPASTGKKGRPAGEPKTKVATRTKGDDGFDDVSYSDVDSEDKEATQNIGSDPTAKELGKEADVSKNPDFDRIRKGLQNKRRNSKDGILSPEDMKLAINIINTAKDKYKFNTTQVDSLRADIGL